MRLFDVTGCTARVVQPDTNLTIYGQQTRPFSLCNASLYNGMSTTARPSGPPIGTIIEGGKLVHNDGNGFGCGIPQGKDALQFGEPWDRMWTDYLTGYNSPVQGGIYVAPTHKDSYVFDCRLPRIAIGARGKQTYIVTDDGVTLREFAQHAIAEGLDTLVNLDGGGSRHLLYNGTLVYQSTRVPYNAIAFYQPEQKCKYRTEDGRCSKWKDPIKA